MKETTVKPEQNFIIDMEKSKVMTGVITNVEAFKDRFIRHNTQKDLVYMNMLQTAKKDDSDMIARLQGEMNVTFPSFTGGELQVFFPETRRERKDLMDSSNKPTLNLMMQSIEDELMIEKKKNEIEEEIEYLKKQMTDKNRVEVERQIQEKKAELQKIIDAIVLPSVITVKPTLLPATINTQTTPTKTPIKTTNQVKLDPVITEPVKLPSDNPITTPESTLPKPSVSGEVIIR